MDMVHLEKKEVEKTLDDLKWMYPNIQVYLIFDNFKFI